MTTNVAIDLPLLPDRTLRRSSVARYLSPETADRIPDRVSVRITAAVRHRLRRPERIPVSDWSERYRVMPSADAMPGKWRREIAPHAPRVMDTWALPWVREVWFCGPDQASKTNTMLSCMGWSIDRAPGNIFYTMPSEGAAKKILGQKLIPMLQLTRPLANKLSKRADDTSLGMIRMAHGVSIYPAWANSPTSTAVFAAKYTYNDEIDKWDMVGSETDPIRRIRKRSKNYRYYKHFFCSTPAGKYIYKGTIACQRVEQFANRCPACGEMVIMDEDHVVIPKDFTVDDIKRDPAAVEYACNACGALWDEHDRAASYYNGAFIIVKGADIPRPIDVGFHLSGLATPDMKLADIAVTITQAKTGELGAKRDLAYGIKCVDYEDSAAERETDAILLLRDDRREAELPSGNIAAISAVADMQKRGFWYKITAWGYGIEQESWLLKAGFVDSWEALRKLFYESEFADPCGNKHHITLRGIDSGGGESDESELSRTAESYLFAYKNPGILLFKGQRRMTALHRYSPQDKIPGTNKALPGGLPYYLLNATQWKNRLAAKLLVAPADPGAWHLHSEVGEDFAKQMCAEIRDEKGYWENPKNKPNHLWDCSYMELALVDIHQVKLWPEPNQNTTTEKKETTTNAKPKTSRRRW